MDNMPADEAAFFNDILLKYMARRIPRNASFELTHRCNLKCIHCYQGDQDAIRKNRQRELDTETVKRILDEIAAAGTLFLFFTGGDPMVRKDFCEIYTYAVKLGIIVSVLCDGILVTDKIIETFKRYPPHYVEISIYGATAETYESVTQVEGSYERFLKGLHRLRENNIRYLLKTVLLTANQHEFHAMKSIADQLGVAFHHDSAIFPCLPHDDNAGGANRQSNTEKMPATVELSSIKKYTLDEPLNLRVTPESIIDIDMSNKEYRDSWIAASGTKGEASNDQRLYKCGAGKDGFHIDPYGMLYPCILTTHHGHDLKTSSFMAGWNGTINEINTLRASPDRSCNSCDLAYMCAGCPAVFELETGAADVKSDYICETTHKRYARLQSYMDKEHAHEQGQTAAEK